MPRKKKEAPNHGKYYEVKAVVGHRIDGRAGLQILLFENIERRCP